MGSSTLHYIALSATCCLFTSIGCQRQSTDAALVSAEQVRWEESQLLVEGAGFPAGEKGQVCFRGRWRGAGQPRPSKLAHCTDGWAQSDRQITVDWNQQGQFEGEVALHFDGAIADVRGVLRNASFRAGAQVRGESESTLAPPFLTPSVLATWAAALLFGIAIVGTRAGAGFFLVGQALGTGHNVQGRAFLAAAVGSLALAAFGSPKTLPWAAVVCLCVHPTLLSWVRGERTPARSWRSLLLWLPVLATSLAISFLQPVLLLRSNELPHAVELLLFSYGLYALCAGHAWLSQRAVAENLALGVMSWWIAQPIAPNAIVAALLALACNWTVLRAAPLFHWTRPSLVPALLVGVTALGLLALGWLNLENQSWPLHVAAISLLACLMRVVMDVQGSARRLSPIGAPDQTLPDLTLA